jgi:hypothetical protein
MGFATAKRGLQADNSVASFSAAGYRATHLAQNASESMG